MGCSNPYQGHFEIAGEIFQSGRFSSFEAFQINDNEILLLNYDCNAQIYYPEKGTSEFLGEVCDEGKYMFLNVVQLKDGRILAIEGATLSGGRNPEKGVFDNPKTVVYEYGPENKKFHELGKFILPRSHECTVTVLPDNNLLVYGGTEVQKFDFSRHTVSLQEAKKVEVFNTKTGVSRFVGEVKHPCVGASPPAVVMPDNKVIIFSGCYTPPEEKRDQFISDDVEEYNLNTNEFSLLGKLSNDERTGNSYSFIRAAFPLDNENILLVGRKSIRFYNVSQSKIIEEVFYPNKEWPGQVLKVNDRYIFFLGKTWPFLGQRIWQSAGKKTTVFDIQERKYFNGPSLSVNRKGGVPILFKNRIFLFGGEGFSGLLDTVDSYPIKQQGELGQ